MIDVFCGAGGFSCGFKNAGFSVLLGVDKWEKAVRTFSRNHRGAKGMVSDLMQMPIADIKEAIGNKKVDVVIGGPPCQGFSMGGARDPHDSRNFLFEGYVKVINGIRPKFFVMENVRGILSLQNGAGTFGDDIKRHFKQIGYETEVHILNAADYGVPQRRIRVFFIGSKSKTGKSAIKMAPLKTNARIPGGSLQPWNGAGKFLLPKRDVSKRFYYSSKMIRGFVKRSKINKTKGRGFKWQFIDPKKPSYTLSARYWKDGAEALVKYSQNEIRRLTPLECARLQSFPEKYSFEGSEREVYTQIGNAVPPLLAEHIAKYLKTHL